MNLEIELKRLSNLQERQATVVSALEQHRADILRCLEETGNIRVEAALNPEQNAARDVDAKCKKLESQRAAAQIEVDKLTAEATPLNRAVERIEREVGAVVHAEKLIRQTRVREGYRSLAARLLEAVDTVSRLSLEAKVVFDGAGREFPCEERHPTSDGIVFRSAGLRPVWDPAWGGFPGDRSRRDLAVENIFNFDRTLVDPNDPVAVRRLHDEEHYRRRSREIEDERRRSFNPSPADIANAESECRKRGEQVTRVVHPLSKNGSWKAF